MYHHEDWFPFTENDQKLDTISPEQNLLLLSLSLFFFSFYVAKVGILQTCTISYHSTTNESHSHIKYILRIYSTF